MNENDKYPDLIIRKGKGTFHSGNIKFDAPFEISHYPENTLIDVNLINEIDLIKLSFIESTWELRGIVDFDLNVFIKDLHLSEINGSKLVFTPYKEIRFGDINSDIFEIAEFPLVGFYKGIIDLKLDKWSINTKENNSLADLEKASAKWNIQFEGVNLLLRCNEASINDFQSKANDITLLLSLALGNDVAFNRQSYFKSDKLNLEIWRRKVDYYFGAEPCIPDFEIGSFIGKTLNGFEKWNKEKKDIFYSVVNFINSSSKGFLEDRLLRLCIAWESLASEQSKWTKLKKVQNDDLDSFKEFLKKSVDDFSLPKEHDKGFIKDRILSALDWEKLFNTLINLLKHYGLDHDKLGFDFKTLIKIRNDVAHSGQFRKNYPKDYLANLIFNNKLGLQILLLKELGYDGLIVSHVDNWKKIVKIDEL